MNYELAINNIKERFEEIKEDELSTNELVHDLVLPFVDMLGYETFNPNEVSLSRITGDKNGLSRVEIELKPESDVTVFILCLPPKMIPDEEEEVALIQRFAGSYARIAVVTDCLVYRFHSDISWRHHLGAKPIFTFDIKKYSNDDLLFLHMFSKKAFSKEIIMRTVEEMQHTESVSRMLKNQLKDPSNEFASYMAKRVLGAEPSLKNTSDFKMYIIKAASRLFQI